MFSAKPDSHLAKLIYPFSGRVCVPPQPKVIWLLSPLFIYLFIFIFNIYIFLIYFTFPLIQVTMLHFYEVHLCSLNHQI